MPYGHQLIGTVLSPEGINILEDISFKGEFRPRFESADVKDNGIDIGKAATARTTLGVSAKLFGLDALGGYVEGTHVNNFGFTDYDSHPAAGKGINDGRYDVVPDAQQSRITQAYLDVKLGKTLVRAGRQMVNLDDQRFVGAVGWRQMFQLRMPAPVCWLTI